MSEQDTDIPGLLRAVGAVRWLMALAVLGCLAIGVGVLVHTVIEVVVDMVCL